MTRTIITQQDIPSLHQADILHRKINTRVADSPIDHTDHKRLENQLDIEGPPKIDSAPSSVIEPDNYVGRLLKYLPAEIVTLYITLHGIIMASSSNTEDGKNALWFVFIACLILTPLYLWKVGGISKVMQIVISMGAFIVWSIAIGSPFSINELWAALILPVYTLIAGIFKP